MSDRCGLDNHRKMRYFILISKVFFLFYCVCVSHIRQLLPGYPLFFEDLRKAGVLTLFYSKEEFYGDETEKLLSHHPRKGRGTGGNPKERNAPQAVRQLAEGKAGGVSGSVHRRKGAETFVRRFLQGGHEPGVCSGAAQRFSLLHAGAEGPCHPCDSHFSPWISWWSLGTAA